MKNLKKLSFALAILGLMVGTLLIARYGFSRIATAVLSVGFGGFALFCAWQVLLCGPLGLAWRAIAPGKERWLAVFVWGRLVRDAAATCLPFSMVGGFVLGARAVALHGVPWPVAAISTVVDLTAEFLAEIAFVAMGLLVLLNTSSNAALTVPIAIGLVLALIVGFSVAWLQRDVAPRFARMSRRMFGKWFEGVDALSQAELAAIYGHGGRMLLGTALHLLGWFGKGVGNWIAFRLLGADVDLMAAFAIEGLLHVVLAVFIFVPANAGVQEAGYVGLGALFGVSPEIALGVSLLRRARDIAIGIPVLLVWQLVEMRRLRALPPR